MKRAAGASILGNGLGTGERREVRPPGNLSLVACVYPSDAHEHDSMTGEDPADRELVTAVAAGDEQAFAALYRRRRGDVYRFAYAMTRSAPFAQDMVQEVFLALLENAARYDPARGSVRAWLLGAARYAVLDRLRAERRFAVRDAAEEEPAAPCVGEEQVLAAQRLERLHAAILELPFEYREALALCELAELSYAECAAVLRCPIGTVRSRLHRARALLAAKLAPAAEGDALEPTLGAGASEVC